MIAGVAWWLNVLVGFATTLLSIIVGVLIGGVLMHVWHDRLHDERGESQP